MTDEQIDCLMDVFADLEARLACELPGLPEDAENLRASLLDWAGDASGLILDDD